MAVFLKKTILPAAAALLALSLAACGGGSNIATGTDAPTLNGTETITATPEQEAAFLGASGGLGSLMLYEGKTSFTWTDESNEDLYTEYQEAWKDSGWELATTFETGADLWTKDGMNALSLFFPGVDPQQHAQMSATGLDVPPIGSTMMVSRVWDPTKPLSADAVKALGWTEVTSEPYQVSFLIPPRASADDANVDLQGIVIQGDFGGAVIADGVYVRDILGVNLPEDDPKQAILAVVNAQPDVQFNASDIQEFETSGGSPAAQVHIMIQDQIAYFGAVKIGDRMLLLAGNGIGFDNNTAWQMMVMPYFETMLRSMQ